jgi:hypothetical protein
MNSVNEIDYLKLSTQRALWGHVFPELRAVSVSVNKNQIDVCFYHNGELTENDRECCELAITEIIADYPYYFDNEKIETEFNTPIIRLDYPDKIPQRGEWVYFRYENPSQFSSENVQKVIWDKKIWPIPLFEVQLSTINALLGRITPCLRSVCVDVNERELSVVFYYDGTINEMDYKLYKLVTHEIESRFESCSPKLEFNFSIVRLDCPETMPLIGHWSYYRAE